MTMLSAALRAAHTSAARHTLRAASRGVSSGNRSNRLFSSSAAFSSEKVNVAPAPSGSSSQSSGQTGGSGLGFGTLAAAATLALVGGFFAGQEFQFVKDFHFLPFFDRNDEAEAQRLTIERDQLDLVKRLREDKEWKELPNPYKWFTKSQFAKSLTATTLRGHGKFGVAPTVFAKKDGSECMIIQHLGERLCGHEDVVHGGLLATILDESLALVAIPKLYGMAYTGKLEIFYRKPTPANSWIVINPKLEKLQGRKAYVHATIKDVKKGDVRSEATAIFIAPRWSLGHIASFFRF